MKQKQQRVSGLQTYNMYANLATLENSIDDDTNTNKVTLKTPNKVKIPPVTVTQTKYNDITNLMRTIKIGEYSLRVMSIGIKIILSNMENYSKVCEALTKEKLKYYTHDTTKTLKFVLAGLPVLDIDEIKNALTLAEVDFCNVVQMNLKNARYTDHALYLVYFNEDSNMNVNKLRNHKYLLNTVVRWSRYRTHNGGPTQCGNCQLYGHGMKNCHLDPRCKNCGDNHVTNNCPKTQPDENDPEKSSFIPRCCLCGQNHPSNYAQCPRRIDFINMRVNASSRKRDRQHHVNVNEKKQFPALPQRNYVNSFMQNQNEARQTNPMNPSTTYSSWFQTPETRQDVPNNHGTNHQQNNNSKFTPTEIAAITTEVILALQNASNKFEQINSIIRITTKYLCNV